MLQHVQIIQLNLANCYVTRAISLVPSLSDTAFQSPDVVTEWCRNGNSNRLLHTVARSVFNVVASLWSYRWRGLREVFDCKYLQTYLFNTNRAATHFCKLHAYTHIVIIDGCVRPRVSNKGMTEVFGWGVGCWRSWCSFPQSVPSPTMARGALSLFVTRPYDGNTLAFRHLLMGELDRGAWAFWRLVLSRNCRSTTAAAENGQYDIYEAYAVIWSAIMALLSGSGSGDGVVEHSSINWFRGIFIVISIVLPVTKKRGLRYQNGAPSAFLGEVACPYYCPFIHKGPEIHTVSKNSIRINVSCLVITPSIQSNNSISCYPKHLHTAKWLYNPLQWEYGNRNIDG
jgi:hypothetical protein